MQNEIHVLWPGCKIGIENTYFEHRVKVFRGRKVHGEYDIKVEQVGLLCSVFIRRTGN